MDEKGDRIHASIGMPFIQRFNQQIKEMGLYIMKNFVVCPNNMKLKTKDHKFKLMFTHKTTVEEIHDPHFNMCIFKFKTYEQLSNPQEFDNTELFDVIGEIVSYEDLQSIKQDDSIRMFMNIEIQDYESNNISATLWGDFVEQIKLHLNGSNDKPIVIFMQLIRAHRYREQYSVRNTWHASKLWINSNLPQVVDFCSRMVSVRGESSQRITQISSHKTHSVVDELASGSVEVKTIEDLSDCKHPGYFWVVEIIVHIELDRGWCYLACKNCAKKQDKEGENFYCKKCEQLQPLTHRYMLQV
ncbi:uncharacterized protein LOC107763975 [Nicotiana tabacum]|uniref:Replication protein A 70 kDa DNA-binding subunit B/D first OB fold domain-containing protein n=6 Tax=Nicotiana TaxID=4085 RepID=A0A1S3XDR3_TOBAC|nr:PREDICTED: uncharacterized protein LOC104239118 [Nicotiana sylvestris]XP_009791955.1 PREDICTED: uncharacterized protein LOC104239118 [Nicotiana sylvestris]XP_009791957.1 PREDICTED: uncharacterized protein LOC104239118 [Nicotiana sylvestris]XP_009791958.1 PREDICTED: uncharacterized protein LOC104239118 [Nicotiana sylvestris]XP_009791959.1 PREDICTED: uncharacterized protein LOC104239118 [Nicotiana sylvestris]XP_009791960.1 PREDICTED: uncharacterized protein LOC104239118 [Nicotiana sylvestris]